VKLARLLQGAFIIASALLVYSFVASAQDGELRRACLSLCTLQPNYVGETLSSPEIKLPDLDGAEHSLSALRGKTVVLVFWTTTCTACKRQMPALAELAEMLRDDARFALLTVAVDDDKTAVREMVRQSTRKSAPFTVLLDPESRFVQGRYGTRLFPETWVIDPQGVIRARFDGPRDWSTTLAFDVLEGVARGDACPLELRGGMATGRAARMCERAANFR